MSLSISSKDRRLLAEQPVREGVAPMFEEIKYCLVWADERPEGLSSAGWELVGDLLIVRGYLHRALPVEQWGFAGGQEWLRTWNWALLDERLEWNGFRRVALTESERRVLERGLAG